jgi:hypothetical protein
MATDADWKVIANLSLYFEKGFESLSYETCKKLIGQSSPNKVGLLKQLDSVSEKWFPSYECNDYKYWINDKGQFHRDFDLPAFITGSREYYLTNGVLTKITDGVKTWDIVQLKSKLTNRFGSFNFEMSKKHIIDEVLKAYLNDLELATVQIDSLVCPMELQKDFSNLHNLVKDAPDELFPVSMEPKVWKLNNKTHRLDGPAIENGTEKSYYICGKAHRTDGPSYIQPTCSTSYSVNGQLHRIDGPAIIYVSGDQYYYQNGKLHRNDGPAYISNDRKITSWYKNGVKQELSASPSELIAEIVNAALSNKLKYVKTATGYEIMINT